ncbi:MAG: hypothetical protein AAF514_12030 [Verrucomicrobiota bacterium]
MNQSPNDESDEQRTEQAPAPTGKLSEVPATRPLNVTLKANERVEWIWTPLPSGGAYVSGCDIIKGNGASTK